MRFFNKRQQHDDILFPIYLWSIFGVGSTEKQYISTFALKGGHYILLFFMLTSISENTVNTPLNH